MPNTPTLAVKGVAAVCRERLEFLVCPKTRRTLLHPPKACLEDCPHGNGVCTGVALASMLACFFHFSPHRQTFVLAAAGAGENYNHLADGGVKLHFQPQPVRSALETPHRELAKRTVQGRLGRLIILPPLEIARRIHPWIGWLGPDKYCPTKARIDAAGFPAHTLRMAKKSNAGKVLTVQKTLNTNLHMAREGSAKYLQIAKSEKNDEFYTILADIERELCHYKKHFMNKVVLCNCDDPKESNFVKFFSMNFEHFGLKKLIATHYKDANLFTREPPYKLEYTGTKKGNRMPDPNDFMKAMIGTGDFRSPECIELLKQADIVVTNPPFSLFREYVAQLEEYGKKFLIVGTWNAITYKEIFKLVKENKIWIGINSNRNFSGFIVPKHYTLHGTEARIDENGNRIVSTNSTCWFTNLDIEKRHEDLPLGKKYSPAEYPKYDNYDAINVNKTNDIPKDYKGAMGVPITFLDKHNPGQFEISGIDRVLVEELTGKVSRFRINGREIYARVVIKNKRLCKSRPKK